MCSSLCARQPPQRKRPHVLHAALPHTRVEEGAAGYVQKPQGGWTRRRALLFSARTAVSMLQMLAPGILQHWSGFRGPVSLKWLALGWCFLCWVVNIDTGFTKFSSKMLLLACAVLYSHSRRLGRDRPCADFPLPSDHRQQFCNRIKGIP